MAGSIHRRLSLVAIAITLSVPLPSALGTAECRAQSIDRHDASPFVLRADFPLSEYAGLIEELSRTQLELERLLGLQKPRERVELVIFRDEPTYRRYLQSRLPQVPYRRAMYVKEGGPGQVLAYRSKELGADLRHESTHGLLHASLPMVPLWLDEGLAEYFEVPADQRATDNPHFKAVLWSVRLGAVPKLPALESKRDVSEMSATDYRNAWAWVHFMLHGPPAAREELASFVADIQASAPPGRLSERLERRLGGLDRQLAEHFKKFAR